MKAIVCCFILLCLAMQVSAEQPTSVIAVFHIKDGQVTPVSTEIVYGKSPNLFPETGAYIITTRSGAGAYQREVWIEDPTLVRILDREEGEASAFYEDDVDFTVILPYEADTENVAVYDRDRKLLTEANLTDAKTAFCNSHPADELCKTPVTAPLTPLSLLTVVASIGGVCLVIAHHRTRR